jgi:serine/threonine protein kinase
MLTGEVPFNADSMVGVIQHHYMTPVPDIRAVRSDVPQELLDIIYCSLNKAPEDRFTTTREMAQALEAVPQAESDREEAERLLRELSAGKAIPKVRTGTLPPLTLTISGPSAPVVPRPVTQPRRPQGAIRKAKTKKKKKNKAAIPAIMLLGGTLAAGGWFVMQNQAPPPTNKSQVVFVGLPADADPRVQMGGSVYQSGDSVITTGRSMVFQASANGYEDATATALLTAGKVDTIAFDMKAVVADAPTTPTPGLNQPAPRPSAQQASQSSATRETNPVNIVATPVNTEIYFNNTLIGTGRTRYELPLGAQTLQFRKPGGCTEEQRVIVQKGPAIPVSHTMSCE